MTPLSRARRPRLTAVHITDDRGEARACARADDTLMPSDRRIQAIRREQTIATMAADRWGWWPMLALPAIVLLGAWLNVPTLMVYIAMIVIGVGIVALSISGMSRRLETAGDDFRERWCNAALRRGVCAVCEYNLHGVEADADGCITCPECGSAWNRLRIRSSSPGEDLQPAPFWALWQDMLLATPVTDDAAHRHSALGLRRMLAITSAPPERRGALEAVVKSLRSRSAWLRIALALVVMAPAAIMGIVPLVAGLVSVPVLALIGLILGPLIFVGLAWLVLRSDIGIKQGQRVRELLDAAFCPVCGGDLEGETPDDRGVISCPDCDARWRRQQ